MKRFLTFIVLLLVSGRVFGKTSRPVAGIDHVLIISVDGLRPDVLLRADTPNMHTRPHVRRGLDLTLMGNGHDVQTFDTFATACAVLGLHPPINDPVIGRFVEEAFDTGDLLLDKYQPKMEPATKP
jgi:hypothetical protein